MMSREQVNEMFNDRCCEQNKTCQCERALGGGAAANQMDRSIFLQRLTFQLEPDSKRSQPCRDWRGGHESNTVGTHGGTWSLLTWRKQVPSPLPPLPPAAWPGALPSPTSLCPAGLCWCSCLHVTQDTAPRAGSEVVYLFTLVSIHNVWQTGGGQ